MKFVVSILLTFVMLISPISVRADQYLSPELITLRNNRVNNRIGDMSFFGGISEGVRLPLTTEQMIAENQGRRARRDTATMRYYEPVFLGGIDFDGPRIFQGTIEVERSGGVDNSNTVGQFDVTHTVSSSDATDTDDVDINREITFQVNYRLVGNQVIFTYQARRDDWSETITIDDSEFTLDPSISHYGISIIQHMTPGVSYYRGDISGRKVFTDESGHRIYKDIVGTFHGYRSAWSATETHRLDVVVTNEAQGWQMEYQVRPSITMNKVLQFVSNEPTVISFDGNFREIMQNNVGLRYDIFTVPPFMNGIPGEWLPRYGDLSMEIPNAFEQLPAHDLTFLRGNPAEDDIRRLFSTQILQGDPRFFQPSQAISRGQFVAAVARAIRLPIEQPIVATGRRAQPDMSVFYDVQRHRPEYPYIMAAYHAGLAVGRANSMFYFDYPIDRQEAFMIMIRALGLSQMGLNPTPVTPFVDSGQIAPWALREVAVANMIGLAPGNDGFFGPEVMLNMGEAAYILNKLVEYMRVGLISDYATQIVNIAN